MYRVFVFVILGMGFLGTGSRSLSSSLALELAQPWAGLSKALPSLRFHPVTAPTVLLLGGGQQDSVCQPDGNSPLDRRDSWGQVASKLPMWSLLPHLFGDESFFFNRTSPCSWQDLISLTRDQICAPCSGRWSLNHWTAREVLTLAVFTWQWN